MLLHLLTAGFGTTETSVDVRYADAFRGNADTSEGLPEVAIYGYTPLVQLGPKHEDCRALICCEDCAVFHRDLFRCQPQPSAEAANFGAIALASKLARIACAVLNKERAFACVKTTDAIAFRSA